MNLAEVMLVLGIVGLALWRKVLPLYIIAGLSVFFIGARWFDIEWQFGISAVLLACFLFYRGAIQALKGNIEY